MSQENDNQLEILVMDANERNAELLKDFLLAEGYSPEVVTDFEAADEVLTGADKFAFAIIDIDRFDSPVWPYCEELEEHEIPFIVLSGLPNRSIKRKSHLHGASAFIDKPIPKRELRNLIHSLVNPTTS